MAEPRGPDVFARAHLRLALLLHGVDVNGRLGGFTSASHTEADIAETIEAWRGAIAMLRAEADLLH